MHAVERRIIAVSGRQDNVISTQQLMAAGLGRGAIRHRAQAGRMRRLHSGVYLLGSAPPTQRGRARAAVLSFRAGAVVSHRTAAELWGLVPSAGRDVDVTVVAGAPRNRAGITIHRSSDLPEWQTRHLAGIPLTSPARTISDIAGTEPTNDVEHALQEARVKKLVTDAQLRAVIEGTPTKNGAAIVRRLLEAEDESGYTRSRAERILRRQLKRAGLPQALANRYIEGLLVDFVWPRQRLIVEVDGFETHGDRAAFERDRRRDQLLIAAGYRVIRITWRQLTQEPLATIARLAQALQVAAAA